MMSTLPAKFLAWLKMTQLRRTVFGALQLLWYTSTHLHVLRIAPVGAVFQRQLFFTGVEALKIVAVFGLLSGALVITQVTSLVGGDNEMTVKILIWTMVREVGPIAENVLEKYLAGLRHGWFIPIGYVVGFFVLLAGLGWHPHEKHKDGSPPSAVVEMLEARSAGGATTPPAPDSSAK